MTFGDLFTIVWSLIQMAWALAYMGLGIFGLGYLLVVVIRDRRPEPAPTGLYDMRTALNTTWCAGCNKFHRVGSMGWTDTGLYRCRVDCYERSN